MGMTIDDTINSFQYMRNHPTTDEEEVIKAGQELFDTAIDTMRKYQKIKQILDNWENSGEEDDPINIIDNIGEVIEDGNDNN